MKVVDDPRSVIKNNLYSIRPILIMFQGKSQGDSSELDMPVFPNDFNVFCVRRCRKYEQCKS